MTTLIVTAAVIEQDDRFLLTRRQRGVHLEGLWEFPGGKCEAGEPLDAALIREMREELDVAIEIGTELFTTAHRYSDRIVELHFFTCALKGEPRPLLGQEMRWVPRTELARLPFPPADAELIARLSAGR